jgi:hypothetical protein
MKDDSVSCFCEISDGFCNLVIFIKISTYESFENEKLNRHILLSTLLFFAVYLLVKNFFSTAEYNKRLTDFYCTFYFLIVSIMIEIFRSLSATCHLLDLI